MPSVALGGLPGLARAPSGPLPGPRPPSADGPPDGEPGGRAVGTGRAEPVVAGQAPEPGGCEEGGPRWPSAWELGAERGNNEVVKIALCSPQAAHPPVSLCLCEGKTPTTPGVLGAQL